eukprot:90751-Pleurochrysis_carterae.AAC.1
MDSEHFGGSGQRGLPTGAGVQARAPARRQLFGQADSRSPPMMDLAFVKNVRPARLERNIKDGCAYHQIQHVICWSQTFKTWGRRHKAADKPSGDADCRRGACSADSVSGDAGLAHGGGNCAKLADQEQPVHGDRLTLERKFFYHAMSCLRRPAGRADKNGSQ